MKRRFFLKILGLLGVQSAIGLESMRPGGGFFAEAATRMPASGLPKSPYGTDSYRLPLWFEKYRVHAHTRLHLRFLHKDIFFSAAQRFREMGIHVFVRHIKSGKEGAWWPSSVGATAPEVGNRNVARAIIESAHKEGLNIIVYHRHMEDEYMARQHPDWVCKNWLGKTVGSRRGDYMCFNSPYPEYFLKRAMELVDMGADGLYFDEIHMPKRGCWCQYCRKLFKQQTGHDLPSRPDLSNPVWNELIDFNNQTIERTFLKWSRELHSRNPNVVLIISANTWPAMVDRHLTNRLFRIADSVKSEFKVPVMDFPRFNILPRTADMKPFDAGIKTALGYTMIRDAADGRPGHIWIYRARNENSAIYAVSGVITHGCIANLDVLEENIPNPAFKKAIALGDSVSPYFAGARPLRWAAVHFPEYGRDRILTQPGAPMKKVLYPFYGAYAALFKARVPVGVITDSQLEEGRLDDYKVLVLPAASSLTEAMDRSVRKFREQGNLVIENQPGWLWYGSDDGAAKAEKSLLEGIGPQMSKAPVVVSGGPERMHAVSFINDLKTQLTVSLCNDFTWVHTGGNSSGREDMIDISDTGSVPPPCENAKITLRGKKPVKRILEVVSGKSLEGKPSGDDIVISVPRFEYLAVVVVEWAG